MTEIITVIANIALALSFVVALVFGVAQVKASARDRKERFTLETLRNFQTRDFAELLQFIIGSDFPKTSEELSALPIEKRVMYVEFAQQMESLGILVAENFINLDLVDKTLGTFVTMSWKKYSVLFLPIRDRDPYIGEYFQWLAARIDEYGKTTPRKPFYLNTTIQRKSKNYL